MGLPPALFFIVFLEGYVVLSSELLAIRQIIPFAGSGTDTISIIIASVLIPLAFGYFSGGRFKARFSGGAFISVRMKLLRNLSVASIFLALGLSYTFLNWLFSGWVGSYSGPSSHIVLTTIYVSLFIIYPVYLLGQTIPLISNYFTAESLPSFTGRLLFYSTLGAFMGAIFCTLVLMAFLGVHHAVSITIASLFLAILILSKKRITSDIVAGGSALLLALILNSQFLISKHNIVENNQYQLIQIEDEFNLRTLKLNHSNSSAIVKSTLEPSYAYIKYIEDVFIKPLKIGPKRDILVMGAGGFTIGSKDQKNNYVFIDIDPGLKDIVQEQFLKRELSPNQLFVSQPARAYLYQTEKKFDLIILDLFNGPSGSPEHLVTREFFQQVRSILKEGGIVAGNFLTTPNFSDRFSAKLDNTIRSVFPHVNRQVIEPFDSWNTRPGWYNTLYIYFNNKDNDNERRIYTDTLNSSMYEKQNRDEDSRELKLLLDKKL